LTIAEDKAYSAVHLLYEMESKETVVVVSVGDNSLKGPNGETDLEGQKYGATEFSKVIIPTFRKGIDMALVHGSGKAAGNISQRYGDSGKWALHNGKKPLHEVTQDFINADVQGALGSLLFRALTNELTLFTEKRRTRVVAIITHILAQLEGLDQLKPSKPIGPYMSKEDAEERKSQGWNLKYFSNGEKEGYRRLVLSPVPVEILEIQSIIESVQNGVLTICCGGGGITLARDADGRVRGIEGVFDKDMAEMLLGRMLHVSSTTKSGERGPYKKVISVTLTGADGVRVGGGDNWAEGELVRKVRVDEGFDILQELEEGTMKPKMHAALLLTEATGCPSGITDFKNGEALIKALLEGRTNFDGNGTIIFP
jgi:carbamate kinase